MATIRALTMATPRITTNPVSAASIAARTEELTTNDTSVNTHSATNTTKNGFVVDGPCAWSPAWACGSVAMMGLPLPLYRSIAHPPPRVGLPGVVSHQVQEREQENPHDVHEVP